MRRCSRSTSDGAHKVITLDQFHSSGLLLNDQGRQLERTELLDAVVESYDGHYVLTPTLFDANRLGISDTGTEPSRPASRRLDAAVSGSRPPEVGVRGVRASA